MEQLGDVLEVASSEVAAFDAAATGNQGAVMTPGILRARDSTDSTALMLDLAAILGATR